MTGSAVAIISNIASGSVRKFLKTLVSTGRPRQEWEEGGYITAFSSLVVQADMIRLNRIMS
jgi:hypothetical protein